MDEPTDPVKVGVSSHKKQSATVTGSKWASVGKDKQVQDMQLPDDVEWPAEVNKVKLVFTGWNKTVTEKTSDPVTVYVRCPNSIITLGLSGHKGLEHA